MKDDSLSDVVQKCICHQPVFLFTNKCINCGLPLRYQYRMNLAKAPNSVGKQENCFSPNEVTNVYAKQIWNDAIDAAAKCIVDKFEHLELLAADEIRKLKK